MIDAVVVGKPEEYASRLAAGRGHIPENVVPAREENREVELLDGAVLDREAAVPMAVDADERADEAVEADAVDRMTVQIERDVVGADDQPVAGAVRKVVVDRRALGDRLATADGGARCRPHAEQDERDDRGRNQDGSSHHSLPLPPYEAESPAKEARRQPSLVGESRAAGARASRRGGA